MSSSSFDDAMEIADTALFSEMDSLVILEGRSVRAIISPMSGYTTESDGNGGFSRVEGAKLEVLSTDMAAAENWGGPRVGMMVAVPTTPTQHYRVTGIRNNGFTTTLTCGSTSGTAPRSQF
jgi:hypothetical protein